METSILNATERYFEVTVIKPRTIKTELRYNVIAIDRLDAMITVMGKEFHWQLHQHHFRSMIECKDFDSMTKKNAIKLLVSKECETLREKESA